MLSPGVEPSKAISSSELLWLTIDALPLELLEEFKSPDSLFVPGGSSKLVAFAVFPNSTSSTSRVLSEVFSVTLKCFFARKYDETIPTKHKTNAPATMPPIAEFVKNGEVRIICMKGQQVHLIYVFFTHLRQLIHHPYLSKLIGQLKVFLELGPLQVA